MVDTLNQFLAWTAMILVIGLCVVTLIAVEAIHRMRKAERENHLLRLVLGVNDPTRYCTHKEKWDECPVCRH